MQILIVEDDEALAEALSAMMVQAGHVAQRVRTGTDALARIERDRPELVLLDLNLPDLDGHEVCRRVRLTNDVPVIMLTARDAELDRVLGLEEGADDYVVKPFSPRELLARIRAIERRVRIGAGSEPREVGGPVEIGGRLSIDRRTRSVAVDDQSIHLTAKEFDVLAFLADDPGAVRERYEIMEHVWDTHWYGPTKTLDAHVAAIRKKLGDARWIEAVRGVGFRLQAPE